MLDGSRVSDAVPSSQLLVKTGESPQRLVLAVTGELDLASSWVLGHVLDMAVRGECRCIVVDLSRLQFMDVSGLHILLDAERRCREQGVELRLRRGSRLVQRLFELTETAPRFQFLA